MLSRLKISTKINFVVVGCLSLFLLVPTLLVVELLIGQGRQSVEQNNEYVTRLASDIYVDPLLDKDYAGIMSLTLGFLQDNRIVNVTVFNADGINITPLRKKETTNMLVTREYQQEIAVKAGNRDEGMRIGHLVMTFDMTGEYAELNNARLTLVLVAVITIALTLATITFLLQRVIKKPIVELSHSVAKATSGDLKQKARIMAKDEIGALAGQINDMTTHLDTVTEQLTQSRKAAEDALQDRITTQQQLVEAEKMASLGTLTAGVAHEINNPLNFIHVSALNMADDLNQFKTFLHELLEDETDQDILQAFNKRFTTLFGHVNTITTGTSRIEVVIEDLRTFTQFDPEECKLVNLVDCLRSTVNLAKTKYQNAIVFTSNYQPVPELACQPAHLNQVFMHLVTNACDAIAQKQLEMTSFGLQNPYDGEVIIGCRQVEQQVEISFKDNGCGMDEVAKTHLFEPFFTTKPPGQGTGLGLSTAWGIVSKHKGTIRVESTLGEGSEFVVVLPVIV